MSTSETFKSLHLDSSQQQAFIKYYNSLPEKPPTTVRIFDRNEYYSLHGADATTAAMEVFSSTSNIKKMGVAPNKLEYLTLSKNNLEILIRKLLLVRRYRVEIYVSQGNMKNNDWMLSYKGSPGCLTQLEEVLGDGLGGTEEQIPCLMAVNIRTDTVSKGRLLGVACVTLGDYSISVTEFTDDDLLTELETITVQTAPSECVVPQTDGDDYKALKKVMDRANVTVTKLKKSDFAAEGLLQDLNRLLKFKESQQHDASAFPETSNALAMTSLAAAIKYSDVMTNETNFGRFRLSTLQAACFLHLDGAALTALHVLPELGDTSNSPARSLYGLLDRCRTQQGKRLLAQWLRQPLRDINLINERLDIVELLVNSSQLRLQLHEDHLRRIPDLQALARRLTRKKANLQDCYKIYQAIGRLPSLLRCLAEANNSTVHSSLEEPISELNEDLGKFQQMIEATMDLEAVDRGDYLVKPSFDEQLQSLSRELDSLQKFAENELNKAADDLRLDAGKTVKLDTNAQFGFHFRVTLKEEQNLRGNKKYKIIDAVKGGVRFSTNKLESITDDYNCKKAIYEKEQDKVVAEIVGIAAGYSDCLFCLSHILSRLDVLVAFAVASSSAPYPYCRPVITENLDVLVLRDVRHPCLEVQEGVSYIPNDVEFKRGSHIMHIVTGANMGGKSTWMRSCGASVLLAHAGCLVPASEARVPRLRALCARVGAADREEKGQSTFMLEMVETAALLRMATPDSLVLVDELGRGTSTFEGCGIAWAIAEELATISQCFCLFATHYHELTRLESLHPGLIVNSHTEASVVDDQLLLLHKIARGPAPKSLGLHVAKLADLPPAVIQVSGYSDCLFCLSHILSRLDVLVAFAVASSSAPYPYCRPVITENLDVLVLRDVRHPCLEVQEGVSYIPNDVEFKRGSHIMHIVTGANMGGKSTWMRSCGASVLLAHAGCLVPASEARVPRLRALCARVGAADREEKGQSTFMLEMVETAALLRMATPDSLVLVDELGRGTSTFEGCGIAWAIAEELATISQCFCLFATHYHELTRLESLHPGLIVNSHTEASVVDDQLLLLHKIARGPAPKSLGLHVAKLADLPPAVIQHAEEKQAQLETNLFEVETAMKSQETSEGQKIIIDFLKKCKQIQESVTSDEMMMKQINDLKDDLMRQNNKYVNSLMA